MKRILLSGRSEKATYNTIITIWYSGKGKTGDLKKKKKNQWLPEVKRQGEMNDQSTEDL